MNATERMPATANGPGTAIVPHSSGNTAGAMEVYRRVADLQVFIKDNAKSFAAMAGVPLEQGEAVVLTCISEGISPRQYKRRYHTIMGSASMRADAMLAEFRMNHGGSFVKIERSAKAAEIEFTDRLGNVYRERLTIEEAMASRDPWVDWKNHNKGLKDNWATPKDQTIMLWWSLVRTALGWICPELDAGVDENLAMLDDSITVQSIRTNGEAAPARKSSLEIAAEIKARDEAKHQTAAAGHATGEVATESAAVDGKDTDDAIDAEYEPVVAAAAETAEAAESTAAAADDVVAGTITEAQREELRELVEYLQIPLEKQEEILKKRGVTSSRSLSKEQAGDILKNLRSFARAKRAAAEGNSGN